MPNLFTQPLWLGLVAVVPLFVWLLRRRPARRSGRAIGRAERWVPLVPRLLVVLLLILAVAGLKLPTPPQSVATVFVVDQSASIPGDIQAATRSWVEGALATAGPDDLAAIVTFDREARVELPLGKHRDHSQWRAPSGGEGTDLEAALRLAAALLPAPGSGPLRRMVLLTDGNETQGAAESALLRPELRAIEIAVWALPPPLLDPALTSLTAPPAAREGEPLEVRIGTSTAQEITGRLRLWANDQLLADDEVTLEPGPREYVVTRDGWPAGFYGLRAALEVGDDRREQNNEVAGFTVVAPAAQVLVVEGQPGVGEAVQQALNDAQIATQLVGPGDLPSSAGQLEAHDGVVLVNVAAEAMSASQMEALQSYVEESGKGLVNIGGKNSYQREGFANSPLESALPVSISTPDKDEVASLALLLVLDRSGSMTMADASDGQLSRIDLAKEGAIQALRTVQLGEYVGVMAFDFTPYWAVPLRQLQAPGDVQDAVDRISLISADGGTDIYQALRDARLAIARTQARVKHIVLLSDGETTGGRFSALLSRMRQDGITVSTVAVSSDAGTDLLEGIAQAGRGRYYFTTTPDNIPQIMTKEARLAARSQQQERDFTPRLVASAPAVKGMDPLDWPELSGYTRVNAKPSAEILMQSDLGDTILAQWQLGLGRAVAWMADAGEEWASAWQGDPAFARLWPQAVRWAMAPPTPSDLHVAIETSGDLATVRVEALADNGSFRNLAATRLELVGPDGEGRELTAPQVAPGRYAVTFMAAERGPYAVRVTQAQDDGTVVAQTLTGFAIPYAREYAAARANRVLLERLAAETGGLQLDSPAASFSRDTVHDWQPQPVWHYLFATALVLFVVDVAVRRFRLTPADLPGALGALGRRVWALRPTGWRSVLRGLSPLRTSRQRPRI
ncbi:MAG: hypothetical protein CL878_04595 [Dehalococcoidia bacterium]|nr:hypothetical protein [Dehalococcoidia bacterium]